MPRPLLVAQNGNVGAISHGLTILPVGGGGGCAAKKIFFFLASIFLAYGPRLRAWRVTKKAYVTLAGVWSRMVGVRGVGWPVHLIVCGGAHGQRFRGTPGSNVGETATDIFPWPQRQPQRQFHLHLQQTLGCANPPPFDILLTC